MNELNLITLFIWYLRCPDVTALKVFDGYSIPIDFALPNKKVNDPERGKDSVNFLIKWIVKKMFRHSAN